MTPPVGHVIAAPGRSEYLRRIVGTVLMLVCVAMFRGAARILPSDCPLRVWALSQSSLFPVGWGDVAVVAGAPALAD